MQKLPAWQSIPQCNLRPWLVLLAGLALTTYASYAVKSDVEHDAQHEFGFDCDATKLKIEAIFQAQKQVLLGGSALFAASQSVKREEWRAYAKRMLIDQHISGIQGLGFALLIPKEQLASHLAEIRQQGFPDYSVRPTGEREVYSSIIYLEPFTDRNLRVFGYDMYSEPVRRAAMAQARDENTAVLSGKVILLQEPSENIQAGTLMYVPVYRKQAPIDTTEQRRSALMGWVYSPLRMDDLLHGVLQSSKDPGGKHFHLKVYDGGSANAANLLYDSAAQEKNAAITPTLFQLERRTAFNGRVWTLGFELVEGRTTGIDYSKVWGTFAAGLVGSLLLFLLTSSYLNTRRTAHRIASELTAELRKRIETEQALNERLQLQSAALDASANAIVITDTDSVIKWANPAFCKLTGYKADEVIAHKLKELVKSGKQDPSFYEQMWQTILAGKAWHGELISRRKDGTLYTEEMTITPLSDEQGVATHFIAVIQDITERKQAKAVFHALFEQASFLACILDQQGRLVEVNRTALGFIDSAREEVIGKYFPDTPWWRHGAERDKLIEVLKLAHAGSPASFEATHPTPSGGHIHVMLNAMPIFLENSNWVAVVGVNITQRKRAEDALRESENRFRVMANNAAVLIWIAGPDKLCTSFNQVWLDFTGRTLIQEMGNGWADGVHPADLQRCMDTYVLAFDARQEFSMDYRLRRFDGEYRWLTDHGVPRYDDQGAFLGYIGSCMDITERHEVEEQAQQLAFYDPLTNLANRRLLSERLSQAMLASRRSGRYGALLFLDLDNFKPLNDTHGHAAGDLLLIEVAKRLKSCVREIDTVARMGGDEFVVMLSELEADKTESNLHAHTVAEKIRITLAEPYQLTIKHDGEPDTSVVHRCTASIGVEVFINQERSQDDILKWADAAMYQAKVGGRNQIRFHEAVLPHPVASAS